MTIARRILLLAGTAPLVLAALGVLNDLELSRIESRTRLVVESQVPSLSTLGNISRTFEEMRVALRDHVLASDSETRARAHVRGKGIPAALFMAVTVTLLRTLARQLDGPGEILSRLNDELAAQNPRGMAVTMTCLEVRGRVTAANAGHDCALLLGPGKPPRPVFPSSGTVLGLFPGQEYQSSTLELPAGESLVLFTDGVTEAADPASVLFGEERLRACLAGGTGQAAADTVDQLLRAVRGFAAGAPQSDDITFVAVRRR